MVFQAKFYKGTRPGMPGVYNRLVRAWEKGDFSHCELYFSDGVSASASFMDHGVRFKHIEYSDEKWVTIDLPAELEPAARQWFSQHDGASYDLMGNLHLVIGFFPEAKRKKFCSEAMGEALGFPEAWRLGPNALYAACIWRFQPA